MKKIMILFIGLLATTGILVAQKASLHSDKCGSHHSLEQWLQDPANRAKYEDDQRRLEAEIRRRMNGSVQTDGIYKIPIVFHIVNANPNAVTDAMVLQQLAVLNRDYGGTNADSVNATGFYNVRGRSQIEFCMAARTPDGCPTNGITRTVSTATFTQATYNQLKHDATGGKDAWNTAQYLNIWVGVFTDGLLGAATFPTTTPADEQGVVIGDKTFTFAAADLPYNAGRTLTHEAGHFFDLRHIWGDASGCATDDGVGDTPLQDISTGGCPSGVRTDACAPSAPGFNYQNYMDYTDDACMTMFTKGQATRMDAVFATYTNRASLIASPACTPPITVTNNVALKAIISPVSAECRNTLIPRVTFANAGNNAITTLSIYASIDGATPVLTSWTGNLASCGTSVTVNLNSMNAANGAHTIKIYTALPNGAADPVPSNDTLTKAFTIGGGSPLPLVEGFESTTFPPAGWTVNNANAGSITWVRTAAARYSGNASAYINNYNYTNTGQIDELRTPNLNIVGPDSLFLSFRLANKLYATTADGLGDTLEVRISTDCGSTWSSIWKKGGTQLATTPGTATGNWGPTAQSEWRLEQLNLTNLLAGNSALMVSFYAKNGYGQNVFLDDINIFGKLLPLRDLSIVSVTPPEPLNCTGAITPSVVFRQNARDTVKSARVNYQIDGGTVQFVNWTGSLLPRGGNTATVALPAQNLAAGSHTIKVWTSLPNALADELPANDTLSKSFVIFTTVNSSITEGFEGTTFPPAGWISLNPDNSIAWSRTTIAARLGAASAYMNNYNYPNFSATDMLYTPVLKPDAGIDSLFASFDVAAVTYSYPGSTVIPLDTLEVLATTDCGKTYRSVYKKWGHELQTILDPNTQRTDSFVPVTRNQWRHELINLTPLIASATNGIQLSFKNTNNYENNIYIDNVNISGKTLPAALKTQGYLIYPSPFVNTFTIQHYLPATDLRGYAVYNSVGQLMMKQSYNTGAAMQNISIDMSRYANGMYTVVLIYQGRTISQKIIKAGK